MRVVDDAGKTIDLICNLCGETLKQIISTDGDYNFCGLEEVKMVCGYGSVKDGSVFRFSFCEKCVDELMGKFKVSAEEKEYLFWSAENCDDELSKEIMGFSMKEKI